MFPDECKYTKDHEWVRKDGDHYTIGITSFAAEQLGDVTFVELPEDGTAFSKGDTAAAVESVKAASDVYAPVGGTVAGTNGDLEAGPEKVNEDPFGAGWFFKLTDVNEGDLSDLMDSSAYQTFVNEQDA